MTGAIKLTEECGVPLIHHGSPSRAARWHPCLHDAAAPLHALRPDATDASWALRLGGAATKIVHVILSRACVLRIRLTDNLATFGHFEPAFPRRECSLVGKR